jgi:hypothetical protein
MFLSFGRKYKLLTEQLIPKNIKKYDTEALDLLDKNTKVAKIYHILFFYLRYVYKLIIIYQSIHNKKFRNMQKTMYNVCRHIRFKYTTMKKTHIAVYYRYIRLNFIRNKRLYKKRMWLQLPFFKNIFRSFYNIIDKMIFSYMNTISYLSKYLENLGKHRYLRNISKLISVFRSSFNKLNKMSKGQLFSLLNKIKKYMWHYKKIIINRIEFRKFNYFIQFITLFNSMKFTLYTYLSNKLIKKSTITYINWFLTNMITNLYYISTLVPYKAMISLLKECILGNRYIYHNILNISTVHNKIKNNKTYFINFDLQNKYLTKKEKNKIRDYIIIK